jgi:hypothetical protein
VYHIELRQFPHNTCRFNLTEQELLATVVGPWAREQWIEIGERKWSPHQARLTVLEGPQIPVGQLSMGRGWGNAKRQSEDVTARVLAQARQADGVAAAAPGAATAAAGAPAPDTAAAPPAGELLALLGVDPAALLAAWRRASERRPGIPPSESLALAETALGALDASPD